MRNASRVVVAGRVRVAKFVASFASRLWVGIETRWVAANGCSSVLVLRAGEPVALLAVSSTVRGIEQLMWVMNPDKIKRIALADAIQRSLVRRRPCVVTDPLCVLSC